MLNDTIMDKISSKLTNNLNTLNIYLIRKLSEQIVEIGNLTPSQLREIYQSVKYGSDINEIIEKIAQYTDKSEKDIIKILEESAKINQEYAKKFYEYRNLKYIPYEENIALQQLVKAIAKRTVEDFENISKTGAFAFLNANGKIEYTELSRAYQRITDEAVLNIMTGRESYAENMKRTMKTLVGQGIQQVDYASGYHRRMDSAVRLNIMEGVRTLEDNLQVKFGEEFGADGIEVVHHSHPAPDHSSNDWIGWHDIDGQQFSLKEEKTIKGKKYESFEEVNNELNRPVGTLNCYHTQIPIILGVSEPIYSEDELKADKEANLKGFEIDGKHYTLYDGTQLQRRLETQIRNEKNNQISQIELAKLDGDYTEVYRSQERTSKLTNKYKELCDKSGLPSKKELLQVENYKKIKGNLETYFKDNLISKTIDNIQIKGVSSHFVERSSSRKLRLNDIYDTISNYKEKGKIITDRYGRKSIKYIGTKSTIIINPDNGIVVSLWKTSSQKKFK